MTGRLVQLDASSWRYLRRALAAGPEGVPFHAIRNWNRKTAEVDRLDWLVACGLLRRVGAGPGDPPEAGAWAVTPAGAAAADLGEFHAPC